MSEEAKPEKFVQTKGARKKAPEVDMDLTVSDDRFEIASSYDKKNPKSIHSWMMEVDATASTLNSLSATVVKREDGTVIRHGQDILIARPSEVVMKRRVAESARSLKTAVAIAGKDRDQSELTLKRRPKAPRLKKAKVETEAEPEGTENDVQD